jgi:hypothetical protein
MTGVLPCLVAHTRDSTPRFDAVLDELCARVMDGGDPSAAQALAGLVRSAGEDRRRRAEGRALGLAVRSLPGEFAEEAAARSQGLVRAAAADEG